MNLCLDAGVNLFDTANVYSKGMAEEIFGKAISGLRDKVLISTKATFAMSKQVNDYGSSRLHLIKSCEDSLRRLGTDHIDIYHMHGFDANTSVEETLKALDNLVVEWKSTLHRMFQLFRLASDEIVVCLRAVWMVKIHCTSGLLFT